VRPVVVAEIKATFDGLLTRAIVKVGVKAFTPSVMFKLAVSKAVGATRIVAGNGIAILASKVLTAFPVVPYG
jgi:hypothetical protein